MSSDDSDNQREPSEVMYRAGLGVVGFVLLTMGAGLTAYGIWDLISAGVDAAGLFALVVVSMAAIGGGWMLRAAFRYGRDDPGDADLLEGSRQRGVLRIAQKYDGRVSLAEITLETSLELSEARALLDEFELHGVADLQISDAGQQVYVFPAFADGGRDRLTAQPPLDRDAEVELLFRSLDDDPADPADPAEQADDEHAHAQAGAPATVDRSDSQ